MLLRVTRMQCWVPVTRWCRHKRMLCGTNRDIQRRLRHQQTVSVAPHSLVYSFSDRLPFDVLSYEILVLTTYSNVAVSLFVLLCSFLPPSSYAIVGYDTVKDAELAAEEHSAAVLDNYELAVFSYPSLQQSHAGTFLSIIVVLKCC